MTEEQRSKAKDHVANALVNIGKLEYHLEMSINTLKEITQDLVKVSRELE